jgi:NAD(P)-dependent dehydrogenase (short-subunit alcohol dehydrogenase family)
MIDSIWNEAPLDILVNNAAGNFIARTEDLSPRAWESVIGIVLMGTLHCTTGLRTPLAQIRSPRHGPQHLRHIRAGRLGLRRPFRRLQSRSRSAHAQPRGRVGQSRHSHERHRARPDSHARRVLRVLPHPGLETLALDRNPLHRFGTVEELANLAAFLVSDQSGYINGEVIRMDGGEFLQGAGEFSNLGRVLSDDDWNSIKPRKRQM